MNKKLLLEAIEKYLLGVILLGILIFIPAGTFYYWNGWLFMVLLFVPMFIAGIIMLLKNPDLLRKRLNIKEKQKEQQLVVKLSGLMFIFSFIIAGLNYRYKWNILPNWIILLSSIIFIISYIMYAVVLKQNTYLSRTIEVDNNQKLIDKGLYKIVRHPMYTATIFLFLSMPLILGSIISFVIMLGYPFIIIKRLKNEEEILVKELKGYKRYQEKVKYKLIPYIW